MISGEFDVTNFDDALRDCKYIRQQADSTSQAFIKGIRSIRCMLQRINVIKHEIHKAITFVNFSSNDESIRIPRNAMTKTHTLPEQSLLPSSRNKGFRLEF